MQPGPCIGPMAINAARGDSQDVGGFRNCHPNEIAKLDQLRLHPIFLAQKIQGLVKRKDFFRWTWRLETLEVVFLSLNVATAFTTSFATGVVDEDAAHRFRRRRKKLPTTTPRFLPIFPRKANVSFMHQGRRL